MAKLTPESAWSFAEVIKSAFAEKSTARNGTVENVENGVAWVRLAGSDISTPISVLGAQVSTGDDVTTELRNGKLYVTANVSDPATGEKSTAAAIRKITNPISSALTTARGIADEAKAVAAAINQHFWPDDNGAHVTDVTQEAWKAAAADDFADVSDEKPYHNLLMNSLGILLRSALTNLVSITRGAIAFYDGAGNEAENITASFGASGATIGKPSDLQLLMTAGAMTLENDSDETIFSLAENSTSTDIKSATVATFADSTEVSTATYSVSDTLAIAGDTLLQLTTGGEMYELDSTYATVTVTEGTGVEITLASDGVTYIGGLLDATGESGTLTLEYTASHYDKVLLDMVGAQTVDGMGAIVTAENSSWSSSNATDTYFAAVNSATGYSAKYGIGSGGVNRGIWDDKLSRWLIHADASKVYLNGGKIILTDQGFQRNGALTLITKNNDTSQSSIKYWRFALTDYGNLRLDKSTNGTSWTAVEYFAKQSDIPTIPTYSYATTSTTATSSAVSIAAGDSAAVSVNVSVPSGYVFGCLYRIQSNHTQACLMTSWRYSDGTVTAWLYNNSSSTQSTTITVGVRFVKLATS